MSFLLKRMGSLSSEDLSTIDINLERDIPKLDFFKDVESDDNDKGDEAAGGMTTETKGNVRVSDSKVKKCLFSFPPIDF